MVSPTPVIGDKTGMPNPAGLAGIDKLYARAKLKAEEIKLYHLREGKAHSLIPNGVLLGKKRGRKASR